MEKVIFSYEGQQIPIVCNTKEFFADIVKRFKTKIRIHKNNLYFVKDAREVPEDATYEMLCNPFDRQNKTIQVLVFEKDININDNMNKSYNNFSSFSPIQSPIPIPNPQSPLYIVIMNKLLIKKIKNLK